MLTVKIVYIERVRTTGPPAPGGGYRATEYMGDGMIREGWGMFPSRALADLYPDARVLMPEDWPEPGEPEHGDELKEEAI